jgi:hypothetical protein
MFIMTTPALSLRPGDQLASTVCTTRVVVIRAPQDRRPLIECGGSPMVPAAPAGQPSASAQNAPTTPSTPTAVGTSSAPTAADTATLIGKRYVDAAESVELLCTSSGTGALTCDGEPMTIKAAKPLPASD